MGGFYTDCDVNKFFDSMTTLFSQEGLSTMAARGAGSFLFEYKKFNEKRADPMASTFVVAESFG